jgi:hypothetical protein
MDVDNLFALGGRRECRASDAKKHPSRANLYQCFPPPSNVDNNEILPAYRIKM